MTDKRLGRQFFARDTHIVAKQLLGKLLMRRWRGKVLVGRINEVESYVGEDDLACHAAKGRTKRTEVMFGEAGYAYVYMIYGMYYCLNVVTEKEGIPAAVLIRGLASFCALPAKSGDSAVSPLSLKRISAGFDGSSKQKNVLNGPGKLCRAMHISRSQNGEDLTTSDNLWVVDDGYIIAKSSILSASRIGVEYAGKDALLPWRYVLPA